MVDVAVLKTSKTQILTTMNYVPGVGTLEVVMLIREQDGSHLSTQNSNDKQHLMVFTTIARNNPEQSQATQTNGDGSSACARNKNHKALGAT